MEDAREIVKEQPLTEETQGLYAQLSSLRAQAMGSGSLAGWWKAIKDPIIQTEAGPVSWLELARKIAEVEESEEEQEEPMNIEHLKAKLAQHLEAGTPTPEILAELADTVPADTLSGEWRAMLRFVPSSAALAFLEIPEQHRERGAEVLEAFKTA